MHKKFHDYRSKNSVQEDNDYGCRNSTESAIVTGQDTMQQKRNQQTTCIAFKPALHNVEVELLAPKQTGSLRGKTVGQDRKESKEGEELSEQRQFQKRIAPEESRRRVE